MGAGRADLVLDSGVRLMVEGPAELKLDSADKAFLSSGKLAVFVPEHAIGFVLQTRTSTLIDQGTEFGVMADDSGATEVHVFRGQVDLMYENQDADGGTANRLSLLGRQARRVTEPGTEGEGVAFSPSSFSGLAEQIAEPIQWPISEGGNGHYYQLVVHPSAVTWQEAAIDAADRHHKGFSGHLLTVTSEQEHRFIVDSLMADFPIPNAWIGLTDVLREGFYRWITDEPYEYQRWAVEPISQPDNYIEREGHGGEDYGIYTNVGGPWCWNDLSNDSIHQSVWVSLVEYEPSDPGVRRRTITTEPVGWSHELGGDGQYYRLVLALQPMSWDEVAKRASETQVLGVPGELASMESDAELRFVVDHILRVCGIPEVLIGLTGDGESKDLRWISGSPLEGRPYTTPNIPCQRVYGQFRWLDSAWRLQTVASELRPSSWFGYLIEYPPADSPPPQTPAAVSATPGSDSPSAAKAVEGR